MNFRHKVAAFAGAIALVATTALTGLAAPQATGNATVSITSDTATNFLAVEISDANFLSYPYSFTNQIANGSLTITATDTRGTTAGWHVNLSATDFTGSAGTFGINNLSLTAGAPTGVAYSGATASTTGISPSSASPVQKTGVSTSSVLSATVGNGAGQFSYPMTGALNIPGGTLVGTYTSVVTVAIVSGP